MPSQALVVTIVGFGRFGQVLADILHNDFKIRVVDPLSQNQELAKSNGFDVVESQDALNCDVLFFCVPISSFEQTVQDYISKLKNSDKKPIFIDVLSVKQHPKKVFEAHLPEGTQAMLTHPMFGPDSVRVKGLKDQRLVLDKFRMHDDTYAFWKNYLVDKGLAIVELSAEEHDRMAAESQGVTHFVGRVLGEFGFQNTSIDTLGARMLHEIQSQVCNDSWQLFEDLQTYNPDTRAVRVRLSNSLTTIFNKLLPNRINKEKLIVGIQGGAGSFNEEAARYYLSRTPEMPYELKYLHTSENVLRALYEGEVDRGQFAIHNSIGGIVGESIQAMANYRFRIVEEYAIKISHALMISPKADFNKVDTIMTHPQVLKQCKKNLEMKYERLKQTSGEGDLVDHAKVAELLGKGELPLNVATMGSKVLAEIHGLQIIEESLQDLNENFTSFLWVERPQ
ncbi:MAG TPA: prephenate dehydrogenase/arogenate dehydrogenase family protein [Oculatellaceae cyanobacterium]